MRFRSTHVPTRTADAVRYMTAVIAVLDDDLGRYEALLAGPIAPTSLSAAEWQTAESARIAVEETLSELDHQALTAATAAKEWQTKAVVAASAGRPDLAAQARIRADEAQVEYLAYIREINAIHVFLQEWAIRVTRASSRGGSMTSA
jgi:hypothetical protein